VNPAISEIWKIDNEIREFGKKLVSHIFSEFFAKKLDYHIFQYILRN